MNSQARKRWKAPKGGRKKAEGPRYPNGRLIQAKGPTPEMIAQRAALVGAAKAESNLAGYALGRLLATGQITRRMHDAGLKFAALYRHWRGLAGIKSRTLTTGGGTPRPDCTEAEWDKADRRLEACVAAMRNYRAVRAVDRACCDDMWTEGMDVQALRDGLAALADRFGMPAEA